MTEIRDHLLKIKKENHELEAELRSKLYFRIFICTGFESLVIL